MQCRTAAGLIDRDAVFAGHIFEQRLQIDFLLILAADGGGGRLPDDGDDRLVVHLGVVQAVEQVDRARPAGGHADADRAGELGVRARHERRQLFVPGLDEARLVPVLAQAREDAVDAVAGVAVDALDAPFLHSLMTYWPTVIAMM